MSLLSYSYCITGISKPADTEFINLKLIIRGGFTMTMDQRAQQITDGCMKRAVELLAIDSPTEIGRASCRERVSWTV